MHLEAITHDVIKIIVNELSIPGDIGPIRGVLIVTVESDSQTIAFVGRLDYRIAWKSTERDIGADRNPIAGDVQNTDISTSRYVLIVLDVEQ